MKVINAYAGDDLMDLIKQCVANAPAKVLFNGDWIIVDDKTTSAQDVYDKYDAERLAKFKAWESSPKGLAMAAELAAYNAREQRKLDAIMLNLPKMSSSIDKMIAWLKRFVPVADNSNITFDRSAVINAITKLGVTASCNTGSSFNADDKTNHGKYILGQALDGLNKYGFVHPVAEQFCKKYQEQFNETK